MDTLGEQTLETVLAFVAMKIELNWKLHQIDSAVFNKAKKEGNSVELVAEEMGLLNWPKINHRHKVLYAPKEIKRSDFVQPEWEGSEYGVDFSSQFRGDEFVKLLDDVGQSSFGKNFVGIDALYLDFYNKNSSFNSGAVLYKDIKFKLPIQQEYGKVFRIDDVTRDKVESEIKKIVEYKLIFPEFDIISKTSIPKQYVCSAKHDYFKSTYKNAVKIHIQMNHPTSVHKASIKLIGEYHLDMKLDGESNENTSSKFILQSDKYKYNAEVAIADDFLEKGAELYFQDVSEDRKTEFRLHLGNCGNLYF